MFLEEKTLTLLLISNSIRCYGEFPIKFEADFLNSRPLNSGEFIATTFYLFSISFLNRSVIPLSYHSASFQVPSLLSTDFLMFKPRWGCKVGETENMTLVYAFTIGEARVTLIV